MSDANQHIPPGFTRPPSAREVAALARRAQPPAPRMSMLAAVKRCLRGFDVFSGRARRAEYWKFLLAVVIGQILIMVVYHLIFGPRLVLRTQPPAISQVYDGGWPATIYGFLAFTPLLTAAWRRLHDSGRPGWLVLIPTGLLLATFAALSVTTSAIPQRLPAWAGLALLAAAIAHLFLLIQLARRGTPGPNRFGPDPLEVTQ